MHQIGYQTQGHSPVALTPPVAQSQWDSEREFIGAMQRRGINFRDEIIPDGAIHRFDPGGKGNKDGWYVFYGMAGAFGDWSQDIHEKWSLKNDEGLSYQDQEYLRAQIEKAKRAADEERLHKHEETAAGALAKWNALSDSGGSPYFGKKKVDAFGVRFSKDFLIIPLRDTAGKLWSLQWIGPDGVKRFLAGGRKKGCFHHIGILENGKTIFITEGYVTGASIHMATHQTTVIAFDAGNLDSVIEELKKAYPKSPIIIAGDDDCWKDHNTGREKAEDAAQQYGCTVIFPKFKNTETKPTDFNDLHVLEGLNAVKEQLKQVIQQNEWPEPKPMSAIKKDLYPVTSLPSALIPEPYQEWLIDIAERMQCPLDYVAVGSILVTASLIGAGCSIKPKSMDSWTVIPNLWGGIIGAPSTLKSPALKEILRPLEVLEKEAFEDYEKDQQNYLIESEAYKATKEVIKKEMTKAAGDSDTFAMNAAKEKLRNLQEPQTFTCKRYSTNDTTIEKMHELLSQNDRGLLLFRDELMGLLASWDKESHESDRDFYLEAWNGYGSKITDRIGRGTIYTKNLCISILGSTQPTKLLSYFQRTLAGVENDGLLQRFQLLVYPDELKEWKLVDRKPNDHAREQAFTIMIKLANMNFCHHGAALDEKSEIPYFHFDSQAQSIFYEWLTELEGKLCNNNDEPILTEHLTKYRKLMPSLALIFHLINIASGKSSGSITIDCVECAAGWCDYLEAHARRIYEIALSPSHQAARNLARRIQGGDLKNHFDTRDIYRKEWTLLKTKEEVELACELLIENGWLREGALSEGRKTKRCYFINPGIKSGIKSRDFEEGQS